MKWTPVTERLPNKSNTVYIKGVKMSFAGILEKRFEAGKNWVILFSEDGYRLCRWVEGHEELENIFWLDESESHERTSSLKECPHCEISPVMCKFCGEVI